MEMQKALLLVMMSHDHSARSVNRYVQLVVDATWHASSMP